MSVQFKTPFTVLLLITIASFAENSKILALFPMCTHSHYMTGFPLAKELAIRGHEVTFVSCYPLKQPIKNFKDIHIEGMKKALHKVQSKLHDLHNRPIYATTAAIREMGLSLTEETLSHPSFQSMLHSNETFDLVITEEFVAPGLLGVAPHFGAKSMLVSSFRTGTWSNYHFGNPEEPSYIPLTLARVVPPMDFFERCWNLYDVIVEYVTRYWVMLPKQDEILHKYLPNVPKIQDLVYNQSLILVNSHISYELPVPMLPNIIEIGGYHVEEPKKLPKELEKIINEAKYGVIFFSLGSNIKSIDLKPERIESIIRVFSNLKQTVLWKYENDNILNQPKNLFIGKWFPQNDILAHPNVKVFISHGGMMSSIEAVYHGIPILGLPVFADQHANIGRAVQRGYAIKLSCTDFTEEELTWALNELITNPKYLENAEFRSKLMHDRPMKPIDTAIYWIEYVIRNGGEHFKSAALDLHWYQRIMLDVVGFLAFFLSCLFYLIRFLFKKLLKRKTAGVMKKTQ